MYTAIAVIVFFATIAMMVREGLWNNLLTTLAIVVAGVATFGLFQPITIFIDEQSGGSYTYLLDIVVLWFTFTLIVGLLKLGMQFLSTKRVRFLEPFDSFGGMGVGVLTAYLMCGFTMAALQTAPLSKDMCGGSYNMGETIKEVDQEIAQSSGITRPDLIWLGLVEHILQPKVMGGAGFSPSVYVHSYAQHRAAFEEAKTWLVKRK